MKSLLEQKKFTGLTVYDGWLQDISFLLATYYCLYFANGCIASYTT